MNSDYKFRFLVIGSFGAQCSVLIVKNRYPKLSSSLMKSCGSFCTPQVKPSIKFRFTFENGPFRFTFNEGKFTKIPLSTPDHEATFIRNGTRIKVALPFATFEPTRKDIGCLPWDFLNGYFPF